MSRVRRLPRRRALPLRHRCIACAPPPARRARSTRRATSPPSASRSRRPRSPSTPGTAIEFQLRARTRSHGFRILGQSIDVTIPKRGRGEMTSRSRRRTPGRYVVRVLAHVRRRAQLHARHAFSVTGAAKAESHDETAPSLTASAAARWRLTLRVGCADRASRPRLGEPLAGITPRRVRGIPARPRRLPRSRDGGGRARPGIQRHELRRLSQRAGRSAAAASSREMRAAGRRRDGRSGALVARRRDAVPAVLHAAPRLPGASCRPRR